MFQLPVSGHIVDLRQPAGAEDLLLLEATDLGAALALEIVARLAQGDEPITWDTVSVTDLEALLLQLRRLVFGDLIRADVRCPAPLCGERVDLSFRVSEYLRFRAPQRPRHSEPAVEPGWYRLRGADATFRLPTGADQITAARASNPRQTLIDLCVKPSEQPARLLKRIELAMEALAPSYSGDLAGQCPECGARVESYFDVQSFVLSELRNEARYLYEEVHLLAQHYHWTEDTILALPRPRRMRYATLLQDQWNRS